MQLESADTYWWSKCPPENECLNGQHNCLDNELDKEKCVDKFYGYKCVCQAGYARDRGYHTCTPVCSKGEIIF